LFFLIIKIETNFFYIASPVSKEHRFKHSKV